MTEQQTQKKIIDSIVKYGGVAINGIYTKEGELDLQCGYPAYDRLYYLAIEVKTMENYYRVMSAIRLEDDNTYTIIDRKKLKKHESLQVYKLNNTRIRGGLALFAYDFQQVLDYVEKELLE